MSWAMGVLGLVHQENSTLILLDLISSFLAAAALLLVLESREVFPSLLDSVRKLKPPEHF